MKFNFKVQQYQTDAVEAVVRVFEGQPRSSGAEYMRDLGTQEHRMRQAAKRGERYDGRQGEVIEPVDYGFRNEEIFLTDGQLLSNIRNLQSEGNIKLSDELAAPFGRCALDVEMETGTGKTYVYIKTIFELNRRYGWSKFIVVVPSVAIREGVNKTFEMTADHFMEHYGRKARFFVYDSEHLQKLDDFSSDAGIHVMIINTQAFAKSMNEDKNVEGRGGDKAARIIYSPRDAFGSRRPIDVIAANRPVLILDEPQRMSGPATQKGLRNFNPLFSINYSATHAQKHNLVYVLDALDAYNKRLVKKIEVKGFEVKNLRGTNTYIYFDDVILSPSKPPRVKLEIEIAHKNGIKREYRILEAGDSLYYASGEMEQYKGLSVSNIDPRAGVVEFAGGGSLRKGEISGDSSERAMRRAQIRETIKSHFEKEEELFKKGIKTLSLFFIDRVEHYRKYDGDGNESPGEYGVMFEEEYNAVLNERRASLDPDSAYAKYLGAHDAHAAHRGYFSIDKNGHSVNSPLKNWGDTTDDISAYDLILKNKERLLSFDEPTRFIFSHSALREGWDNPNVFQICALKHGGDSKTQKRQEVGRGMRLCVDQNGTRMDADVLGEEVQTVNKLTVVAGESYGAFVAGLQQEIKDVLYERPTKANEGYFFGKTVWADGKPVKVSERQARAFYQYLVKNDYVDEDDAVTQKYREDAAAGRLAPAPESLKPIEGGLHALVRAVYDEGVFAEMFEDGNRPKITENPLNERFYKREFQTLWNAVNHKYAYTVDFDSGELIGKAAAHIDAELFVSRLQYTISQAAQRETLDAAMVEAGASFEDAKSRTETLADTGGSRIKYDLIGKIAAGTTLTRRTAAAILQGIKPETFAMYRQNPEEFISKAIRLINEQKAAMIVEHIVYDAVEGSYDSSIFTAEKHAAMERAYPAKKAIQQYVFTDGLAEKSVERKFAESMDGSEEVFIYAKLPRGFRIPTPVGDYSPDWAIVFHEGKVKHIYFVAETKGTLESLNLRPIEKAKIDCAKKLFARLSGGLVTYDHVDSFETLLNKVMK